MESLNGSGLGLFTSCPVPFTPSLSSSEQAGQTMQQVTRAERQLWRHMKEKKKHLEKASKSQGSFFLLYCYIKTLCMVFGIIFSLF